jgi:CRISPR-associated protein Csc2
MLNTGYFHAAVPQRPMGRYAHIIVLRETDSYALFQTDGELNTARVQAGREDSNITTRLTMFKRKQTTPERLVGREILRRYGFVSGETAGGQTANETTTPPVCDYNVRFCMQCPDCITYGFAIGDAGSEKSKIYSDTAYSLTPYETSHEAFTLNAPYESGTMSRRGEVTSRINEQDHVRPQTLFPTVITFRDPTSALFHYVLNNVLRTRRYGAQTTRTGTMTNHVVGIVLADGEIFSNLLFTQALHDALRAKDALHSSEPVAPAVVLREAGAVAPALLASDGVQISQQLFGAELQALLDDLRRRTQTEGGIKELLNAGWRDSQTYYEAYIKKQKTK